MYKSKDNPWSADFVDMTKPDQEKFWQGSDIGLKVVNPGFTDTKLRYAKSLTFDEAGWLTAKTGW